MRYFTDWAIRAIAETQVENSTLASIVMARRELMHLYEFEMEISEVDRRHLIGSQDLIRARQILFAEILRIERLLAELYEQKVSKKEPGRKNPTYNWSRNSAA